MELDTDRLSSMHLYTLTKFRYKIPQKFQQVYAAHNATRNIIGVGCHFFIKHNQKIVIDSDKT